MDEFIVRAAAGGVAIALAAGPVGALMLWRRRTFLGASIAHGAVLGVALALLIGAAPLWGAVAICIALGLALEALRRSGLSDDTLIGVIGHAALALAMIAIVYLTHVRVDLLGYLFGDILSVTWSEVGLTLAIVAAVLASLAYLWRPLIAATIDPDIAAAEGVPVGRLSLAYTLILALVVALGLKLAGALLVIALLVMPAAAARAVARSPAQMAIAATAIAIASVLIGLALSWWLDWPAGPAIAVAGTAIFLASLAARS